ncbi:TPA: hypothetical protein DF272_00060 [Candidatus Falkowbacteria bacterium]|nr:hypothetical protein [Candidatus Falkowbacteria bacterium]
MTWGAFIFIIVVFFLLLYFGVKDWRRYNRGELLLRVHWLFFWLLILTVLSAAYEIIDRGLPYTPPENHMTFDSWLDYTFMMLLSVGVFIWDILEAGRIRAGGLGPKLFKKRLSSDKLNKERLNCLRGFLMELLIMTGSGLIVFIVMNLFTDTGSFFSLIPLVVFLSAGFDAVGDNNLIKFFFLLKRSES